MKEHIPINPKILIWARKTAGISILETANRIGKSIDTIEAWEAGTDAPTYIQLEKLAYQIYKRPLALFFFPNPPNEVTPEQSFRTLPAIEIEKLPPRINFLIRKARVLQENLKELHVNTSKTQGSILENIDINIDQPITYITKKVRDYIGVSIEDQTRFSSVEKAFKIWRDRIESCGIYIFKEAFKENNFSGFCLYDIEFPIIYINNSQPATRQIFTLFHELAHLLFKTGGLDLRNDSFLKNLTGENQKIEVLCNQFAGAFLVPQDHFNKQLSNLSISDYTIEKLAELYKVSRLVILRRLFDKDLISKSFFEQKMSHWNVLPKAKNGNSGGNYFNNIGVYLSKMYSELAFSKYYKNQISEIQLAAYLNIKPKGIPELESRILKKVSDMTYVFDSNTLINIFRYYYPKNFPSLWKHFDHLISTGKIISTREVFNEVTQIDDRLKEWAKDNRHIFEVPQIPS